MYHKKQTNALFKNTLFSFLQKIHLWYLADAFIQNNLHLSPFMSEQLRLKGLAWAGWLGAGILTQLIGSPITGIGHILKNKRS